MKLECDVEHLRWKRDRICEQRNHIVILGGIRRNLVYDLPAMRLLCVVGCWVYEV